MTLGHSPTGATRKNSRSYTKILEQSLCTHVPTCGTVQLACNYGRNMDTMGKHEDMPGENEAGGSHHFVRLPNK